MSTSSEIIIAFDLYGTLLSTASVASKLSELFGEDKGPALAAAWRVLQLEYTWRLNSMQSYEPFSTVTQRSLAQTLADHKLSLSADKTEELMRAYDSLSTFEDVRPALEALKKESGVTAVVFSNGTKSMVSNSVQKSDDLAPYQGVFKDLVVIEDVRRFKPDPEVYKMLAKKMGKETDSKAMSEMWLVSGNPFDVVGARTCGMQAAWVDRAGNGWTDRLIEGDKGRPTVIVKGLGEVVEAVRKHAKA